MQKPDFFQQSVEECSNITIQLNKNKIDRPEKVFLISFGKEKSVSFDGLTKKYY